MYRLIFKLLITHATCIILQFEPQSNAPVVLLELKLL